MKILSIDPGLRNTGFAVIEKKEVAFKSETKLVSNADAPVFRGVANIGIRPTIGQRTVMAEVHLFDFNEDIYGARLCINLHHYMRGEKKFASVDLLKDQILKDTVTARKILSEQIRNKMKI